jgi:hypothetical protein
MFEPFLDPNIPLTLKEAGNIMLPIAGTLLGLVYAANIYWLQDGIKRLEFSRSILEELIISNAKIILDLLIISAVTSILALLESMTLITIAFLIFTIIFTFDLLRALEEQGFINILFSSHKNKILIKEDYSELRKFSIKLYSSGFPGLLRLLVLIGFTIIYPLWISIRTESGWMLSSNGAIIFIFSCTFIALLQIKPLMAQAFDSRKEIERTLQTQNEDKAQSIDEKQQRWSKEKRVVEEKIISECLCSLGVVPSYEIDKLNIKNNWTSRDLRELDKPVLPYRINVNEYGSVFLIVIIPYLDTDKSSREFIYKWAKMVLISLAKSKTDVRQYAISFFRKDSPIKDNHFGILGGSRNRILSDSSSNLTDEEFIRKLSRRYLSDAVAEY